MRLAPERTAAIYGLLDNIAEHIATARKAGDTQAALRALDPVWFLLHDTRSAITDAEAATRREALAHVEGTAA